MTYFNEGGSCGFKYCLTRIIEIKACYCRSDECNEICGSLFMLLRGMADKAFHFTYTSFRICVYIYIYIHPSFFHIS